MRNSATNYREVLQKNSRKTIGIMILFVLIYTAIGLLIDVIIQSGMYQGVYTVSDILFELITFRIIPIATIIFLVIALVAIMVTLAFHNQIMLLGTQYQEITPENAKELLEKQIYNTVEEMKISAGLHYMPKVFLIHADYMNAFASGFNEKNAMIAITTGLATKLTRDELQAVLAHELSHIRHGDIKLTIVASILSNLMLMVVDMLFWTLFFSNSRDEREDSRSNQLMIIVMLLKFILPLLTMVLMLFLSRTREYMADSGAVELMRDNTPMARALLKIAKDHGVNQSYYQRVYQNTPGEYVRHQAYIFDPMQAGISNGHTLSEIFSTHPSIENRIKELGFKIDNE